MRHRLDGANTGVEDTDLMVLTQRWETEIGWCYIDWMVLHRLDGANTEVGNRDWMLLTQRRETETGWC